VSCEPYSSAVKLVHGAYRLVTPAVSRLSSLHFGCQLHTDAFGPILQTLVLMLLAMPYKYCWQNSDRLKQMSPVSVLCTDLILTNLFWWLLTVTKQAWSQTFVTGDLSTVGSVKHRMLLR